MVHEAESARAFGARLTSSARTLAIAVVGLVASGIWLGTKCAGYPSIWSVSNRADNVLIVSIDTIRADRVGSYGYAGARTPTLDALAARGLRFRQASTVMPLTLPAHASLLTGTFPAFHGVRDNGGFYLSDEHDTLAEILHNRGLRTGAFVGSFVLDSRWGLRQGFDKYFDDFDLSGSATAALDEIQRPANEVVDQALQWLGQDLEQPFFAWVHLYDPHTPYAAPEPFRAAFPRTLDGAYDAEIAFVDQQIGRLIAHLTSAGQLDRTLIVAVGDHGESLGEHEEYTHGFFLYDAALQVPLIMAGPGVPHRTVDDQVRIVDVMPTVLEFLGLSPPDAVQGATLVPAARGERLDLVAFAETWFPRYHYGWNELMAVRDGRYKFILAPRRELYDLQADPREQRDLSQERPARVAALEQALRKMLAGLSSDAAPSAPQPIDPDAEARLRALGYVGSSSARYLDDDKERADPKDRIRLYNLLKAAATDSAAGQLDLAIEKVQQALAQDAGIIEGHTALANLYLKADRPTDAVESYQRALALDPEHLGATFSLALTYKQLGNFDAAQAGFERSKSLDPRSGKSRWQLADIWMQQGEFPRAEQELIEALELTVDRPSFLLKLGECYLEMRRLDEADARIRAALDEKPDLHVAHYDLGLIYEARNQPAQAIRAYETELARNSTSYSASFNLGKLLDGSGRAADARARFRETVSSNPTFAPGHLYLAKSLLDEGDLRGAEESARRGLNLDPAREARPLGHYVLADVYNRLGRSDEANRQVALARRFQGVVDDGGRRHH